jgi:hypothetical protein
MRHSQKSKNPFYVLLVIAGVLFVVTATAYCVMAFRDARAVAAAHAQAPPADLHPLDRWMRQNGETALIMELAFLAVFVVGAIATDDYWQRRATSSKQYSDSH